MINVKDSEETVHIRKRRKLSEDEVELAPEVHDIPSLIEIAQRKVRYQNLDSTTLWKILPELVKLNSMIGMHDLKRTLFYQHKVVQIQPLVGVQTIQQLFHIQVL